MTIEQIVEYVLHTPHNTNKAILIGMLKQLIKDNSSSGGEGGSGSGDIIYDGGMETWLWGRVMLIRIDKELFQWEKNRYIYVDFDSNEPKITYV